MLDYIGRSFYLIPKFAMIHISQVFHISAEIKMMYVCVFYVHKYVNQTSQVCNTYMPVRTSKHPGEQNSHSNFAEAWQVVITLVLVNQKSCHKNAEVVFFYVLEAKKKSFKNTTFVPFKVINILEYIR